ncbi:Nicalin-1 [Papilio machaon]|uniref:BOS complex subunit NCLN n=1 Tax=Papilio machaon TaxID=76193 RepID=A0A194QVM3_PAPMA|nr:Nicalin-1 [Papilio machaon]
MWLDEADGFAEIFRGYLPYYLLVALPIFIIMSPVNPVAASHEFSVYRMQQYDLHSVPHGCRSASFNLEGRSLTSWSTARHCVVARLQDITIEQFMEIRSKSPALLLVLPKNNTELTDEQKEHIQLLEMAMIQQEMLAPVYFAEWSPEFEEILKDLQHSFITDDKSGTALEAMFNTVSSNGYQIVVSAPTPQKLESKPVTLHGKLVGRSAAQTIVIAAHYDASGLVPELAQGADSNASGAVAVLELSRIFSRLYSSAAVRGGPSLLFVLTSVGHSLNYFATKKWLEEQLDVTDASLLQDVSFVLCLDSISSENLNLHVSKPPKPGGAAHSLRTRLNVPVVHKKINLADELLAWHHERFSIRRMTAFTLSSLQKINLADELLAWHHERFSIRRMTAFTLSSLQSHKDPARSTILDTPSEESLKHLVNNIMLTARALASHIYNLTDEVNDEDATLYDEALGVDEAAVRHWYKYLSSQPRAPQIITTNPPNTGVTGALEKALSRYVDVTASVHSVDKREPEYVLYSPLRTLLYVYSVKPAVFDLILTLAIVAYLSLLYFAIQMFPKFYEEYALFVTGKAKVN